MKLKLDEIKHYDLEKGTVVIYRSGALYFVAWVSGLQRKVFGCGVAPRKALHEAEYEWRMKVGGGNPFTVVLQMKEKERGRA